MTLIVADSALPLQRSLRGPHVHKKHGLATQNMNTNINKCSYLTSSFLQHLGVENRLLNLLEHTDLTCDGH